MDSTESFLPYGRQSITESDINAVIEVLRSPFLTQGPVVPLFERGISEKVGSDHAIAVNSATSALHISCLALGLGPGDWVWTSPITFVASANCARYCGANVDFVDIDPSTGLISVSALEQKFKRAELEGVLPKILIPVHLCGTSCAMKQISSMARRYGCSVLEDASHAVGARYQGEFVGSCSYSEISVFSFHPVKIITSGEGGMATTNNPQLAQRMADLRSHGITKDQSRFELTSAGPWSYEQQDLGFNYRMTDLQAALGLSQLQRLDQIVVERQRLHAVYEKLLANLPVRLLSIPPDTSSSLHLAVIRLTHSSPDHHRYVFEGLRSLGIGVQMHYSPVHLQPYYQRLGFKRGDFPEAEAYGLNAISLPLYPGLQESEQLRVVRALSQVLSA